MDYQKMWMKLRSRAVIDNWLDISYKQRQSLAALMSNIEIEEAKEEQKLKDQQEARASMEEDTAGKDCENESTEDKIAFDDNLIKCFLSEVFGDKLIDSVNKLETEMVFAKDKVILIADDLKVPEELEKEAKEKNITLARVRCVRSSVGIQFPLLI